MEEQILIYKTMYALLTEQLYAELNLIISKAKGYPDESGTIRYAPEEPIRDINNKCVMPITSDIQENYPELLKDIKLVESYIPKSNLEFDNKFN